MSGDNDRTSLPLLAGRYVLGEPFASGGMGSVHLGRIVGASGFSRVVAIKRLFPGFSADGSFRQMLLDEARFASRIRQPNVVPILDVVESERDLYVVMEYVHGLPLAGALAAIAGSNKTIPVPIALAVAEAVLFGLHAAHEARNEDGTPLGIVHRDVSPQNVLLGADGVPRLIDFGIAKAATRIQATDPGVLKGKAGYMAPEQLLYEPVSRHADVFSASVVLWEMLTARRLFPYDVTERVRRAAEPLTRPSQVRQGIDAALDGVVLRGLERDPGRRFPTAEAMALELRRDHEIASAVEVGRWLADVAGDELEISEERVRLFEQLPSYRTPEAPAPPVPLVTAVPTVSTIPDAWHARDRPRRGRGWIIGGGVAVAAVLALLAPKLVERIAPAPVLASPIPESARHGSPIEPLANAAPPSASPAPLLPSAPVAAASASASAPTPSTSLAATSAKQGTHSKKPKAKCDPPYTIDADGFKHYDHNCF